MYFKNLVVFAFTLHIYLQLCKATNLHRLFTIIFYWSKATFMVYLKKLHIYIYIYIYMYIYIYIYIYIHIYINVCTRYMYIQDTRYIYIYKHIYIYVYIYIYI